MSAMYTNKQVITHIWYVDKAKTHILQDLNEIRFVCLVLGCFSLKSFTSVAFFAWVDFGLSTFTPHKMSLL